LGRTVQGLDYWIPGLSQHSRTIIFSDNRIRFGVGFEKQPLVITQRQPITVVFTIAEEDSETLRNEGFPSESIFMLGDITLDAVKEFQVVATGANAEFGLAAILGLALGTLVLGYDSARAEDTPPKPIVPGPWAVDLRPQRRLRTWRVTRSAKKPPTMLPKAPPAITVPVASRNTLAQGNNAVLLIELDGSNAAGDGLTLSNHTGSTISQIWSLADVQYAAGQQDLDLAMEEDQWLVSISSERVAVQAMLKVTVTVSAKDQVNMPPSFTLVRLLRDPLDVQSSGQGTSSESSP